MKVSIGKTITRGGQRRAGGDERGQSSLSEARQPGFERDRAARHQERLGAGGIVGLAVGEDCGADQQRPTDRDPAQRREARPEREGRKPG
jgi:hypothetical protein